MPGQGRPFAATLATIALALAHGAALAICQPATANDAPSSTAQAPASPTPEQDDATLHHVTFVGQENGWAVGDRGVVWKTTDGGRTWQLLKTPVDCALKCACFLSDRVGWVAGGGVAPYTQLGFGVVLFTNDGGATWRPVSAEPLPALEYVRFFTLQEGVAVGASDPLHPTGMLATHDGGKTWTGIDGPRHDGWRAADFLRPEVGVAAGLSGAVAQVDGKILPTPMGRLGLQNLHSLKLNADNTGWLVGDGGLVLRTENRGVVWHEPAAPLPNELRNIVDFRAVACRGEKVWLAGDPGSVVWHSSDGGRTWTHHFTQQTSPLECLHFVNDEIGWGVGAFGAILATADGGRTWHKIRGGDRRAALMTLHAYPQRVSFPLLVRESADLGYRGVVLLPARADVGPEAGTATDLDLRLDAAVIAAGGSSGAFGWQFPLALPDLGHDAEKLLVEWNRATEGKLQEVLLGRLVRQLRTWKPDVVVLDEPPPDDAATRLLNEAVLAAVTQAADSTWHIPQSQWADLRPWRVSRVYLRVSPGSAGHTSIELHKYLPRLGNTVQAVAAPAASRLVPPTSAANILREEYRLLLDQTVPRPDAPGPRDFFAGLALAPDSAARRPLPLDDGSQNEEAVRLAHRQRNLQSAAEKFQNDPRLAAQLIAQLHQSTDGLRSEQAAQQLLQLAETYRRHAKWDLAEATLIELVGRFPNEPAAVNGMRRLFQTWAGAEPAWQRLRATVSETTRSEYNNAALFETFDKMERLLKVDPALREVVTLDSGPDPLQFVSHEAELKVGGEDIRAATLRHWQNQALRMAALIRAKAPALYASPEIQFPLSALCRQRGLSAPAQQFLGKYHQPDAAGGWSDAAAAEISLAAAVAERPKSTFKCRGTSLRPVLDGLLSDECWQDAEEIRLTDADGKRGDPAAQALLFFARDAEHLYFAASVPRSPAVTYEKPQLAGRTHDADVSGRDRIVLTLDVDRDYATWYVIEIDQRGLVSEACGDDPTWNPQMWVAIDADDTHWRIEAAIPFDEMVPQAPRGRDVWALGAVRVIPAVGVQGFTHPSYSKPRPETFGQLRFE